MQNLHFLLALLLVCVAFSWNMHKFSTGRLLTAQSKTALNLFGSPEPPKAPQPKKDGGFLGALGGLGNMGDTMKKMQELQKNQMDMQKELTETVVTAQDPTGQVTASFTGLGVPIGVKVSDSILAQGSEAVSLAASQAMVDAHLKATNLLATRMQALYSGLGLPGMAKM